jgi:hypothetical protein
MVSISNLLDWKPASLGHVADVLTRRRKRLVDLQDEIDAAKPPRTWASGSASEARAAHEKLRLRLLDMAAEVSDVAINLDDAQTRVLVARNNLQDALDTARTKGFTVDHATGVVKDPQTYEDPVELNSKAVEVNAVAADISAALTAAQEADLDLAASLQAAVDGKIDGGTGSLSDAINQLPTRMDQMTPAQLAEMLGGDVAIHTISAYLEVEAELATWEIEGKAKADYKVMADGTVIMALHLEAGLGREIEVGGAEADVGAGGSTDLELKFDSAEEAQAFLDGLVDAAFDVGFGDVVSGQVAPAVARNVAEYIQKQDIESFRTGVYASGELEFDEPWAKGAIEGRAEAYYDWAKDLYGLKLEATADAELGGEDSGYNASAALSGDVQIQKNGEFESLTLAGKLSATAANEQLGIAMPAGTSTGAGVDVQLTVDKDNPAINDIRAALSAGELDRAKDLAFDNGELVVRQTVVEEYASEEHEIDLKVAEVEIKYGASGETATQIWYREPGHSEIYQIDPAQLPVNQGG